MRIAVVGAGAIGACFGAMLAEAGCEVSLIARGAHLDAIRVNGLTIRRGDETRTRRLAGGDARLNAGRSGTRYAVGIAVAVRPRS